MTPLRMTIWKNKSNFTMTLKLPTERKGIIWTKTIEEYNKELEDV